MNRLRPPGRSIALGVAVLRVALLPVLFVGEAALPHPGDSHEGWDVALGCAALWTLGLLAAHGHLYARRRDGPAWLRRVEPAVDLLLLAALMYTSGGAFSNARKAFFVVPFAAAVRATPALTALWSVSAIVVYALIGAIHHSSSAPRFEGVFVAHMLYLCWAGAFAVFLAAILQRRSRREATLAEHRDQLATQALAAEGRERQRLAERLHDDAVQNLLAARQELAAWRRHGEPDALDRLEAALDETLRQLRGEIFELHPQVLDHAGLAAALRALGDHASQRARVPVTVIVDPAAEGVSDLLVASIARELLANAVKHASATSIAVTVRCQNGSVVLGVCDDGVGFVPAAAERAVESGHIGLAAVRQRVTAAGGELDLRSEPGAGSEIHVRVPIRTNSSDRTRPISTG